MKEIIIRVDNIEDEHCINCMKPLRFKQILTVSKIAITLCDDCLREISNVIDDYLNKD